MRVAADPADPLPRRMRRLPSHPGPGGRIVHRATGFAARLLGLAGLRAVPTGHALLLPRTRSVHTFGMRVPIDLVWCDGDGRVVRIDEGVRPGRLRGCREARSVLETAAGEGRAWRVGALTCFGAS